MALVQFGGDFELHFYDPNLKRIIPAEPILGVDKNAYISSDHTAAEIRPTASNNIKQFVKNTRELLIQLKEKAKKSELDLVLSPANTLFGYTAESILALYYTKEELGNKSENTFKYYCQKVNQTLIDKSIRTQGGHIHLLCKQKHQQTLVKLLDIYIAIPFMLIFDSVEETIRRKKYGQAGNYRNKGDLLEYRVLSSNLIYSPEILSNTLETIDTIQQNSANLYKLTEEFFEKNKYNIPDIINNGQLDIALELWSKITNYLLCQSMKKVCEPSKKTILLWINFINYYSIKLQMYRFDSHTYGKELFSNWLIF